MCLESRVSPTQRSRALEQKQKEDRGIEKHPIVHSLLERLAPTGGHGGGERIWRFTDRMATVYQGQVRQFDEDAEASQWRRLYSAKNMPPPSDTPSMAEVAAMLAFYSPSNFCKFQKLFTQQLLEWESRQARLNPYPLGVSSVTIIDIGAGLGIASLAAIDVLATWTDVLAQLGHAKATAQLLVDLPMRSRLPLASEPKQRGPAARAFTSLLYPGPELSLQWNRVRFYSPRGSYWHSLRRNDQSGEPDWATGFWSLAHWGAGSTTLTSGTPDALASARI